MNTMIQTRRSTRRSANIQRKYKSSALKPKRLLGLGGERADIMASRHSPQAQTADVITSIAFTGLKESSNIEQYEKWSIELGLKVLSDDIKGYDEKTVLIAAPRCSSIKFMCGLSTTQHIVTEQWLHACNDLNRLVPTSEYIVDYASTSIQNGKHLRASGKYLLSGKSVHRVIGTSGTKFNKPSLEELKELVEASGGAWVSTQRKAGNSHAPDLLILMDDNDFDKPKQAHYIQTLLEKGATKICWSDLKNCLLAQSLEAIFDTNAQSVETTQEPKKKTRAQIFKATLSSLLTPPQMKRPPMNDREAPLAAEVAEEEVDTSNDDTQEASPSSIPDQKKPGGRDEAILVYSTELKFLQRNLSNSGGDRRRGQIGAGAMNITKSSKTGLISVQVFNHDGLSFQAEVHPNFSGLFGNAGKENILGWDAYDTSGNIISEGTAIKKGNIKNANEAHVRRFYFHFGSREHLTCVLFALFGGDDNARKLTEEFFDGNSRFCPQEEPELPHRVLDPNSMDIDSINGSTPVKPLAPTSRVLFDNDPQEPSQLY